METSNQTILTLMISLLWRCLSVSPYSSTCAVYQLRLSSQSITAELLTSMSMNFAPGLLEVLQSATPPTIAFFKSLPTLTDFQTGAWWAVYAIVLEKPGCRSITYIGSSTNERDGIRARFYNYNNRTSLPRYVNEAILHGFTITHKGLLCWILSPGMFLQFTYRMMFLALEATFSFVFWTMKCETDYGFRMTSLCLWPRESLEYDGACSHSPLTEIPYGNPDLSAEECEELEMMKIEKRAASSALWRENNKEHLAAYRAQEYNNNKEYYAELNAQRYEENWEYHAQYRETHKAEKAAWNVQYRETNRADIKIRRAQNYADNKEYYAASNAQYYQDNKEDRLAYHAKLRAKTKEDKRFHCDTCDRSFDDNWKLNKHFETQAHMRAAGFDEASIKAAIEKARVHRCEPCKYSTTRKDVLQQHQRSDKHKAEMRKRNKTTS